jgi:hypothetical protein
MAMKKADMEVHREAYYSAIEAAKKSIQEGQYHHAIILAYSSWEYIDGMMQYERRYHKVEFENLVGIDLVLQYAPLLFDYGVLNQLETLLKSQRRIEKNTSQRLSDRLAEARTQMRDAHSIWNSLEEQHQVRVDECRRQLGVAQERVQTVVDEWDAMGIAYRTIDEGTQLFGLTTQMDRNVKAKCPHCGMVVLAPKVKILNAVVCPGCRNEALCVLLRG